MLKMLYKLRETTKMKKIMPLITISVLILVMILTSGCDNQITGEEGNQQETTDTGIIRLIHVASSTPDVDLAYLDQTDNQFYVFQSGATYGSQYGYYSFLIGDRSIIAYAANTDIIISAATFSLGTGEKFSVIAVDFEATIDPELLVVRDTIATAPEGFAYARFIHAAADGGTIKITEKDTVAELTKVAHLHTSGYLQLEARTFEFEIYSQQSQEMIMQTDPVTLLSGHSYSIILSGSTSNITPVDYNAKVYRETSL
jgi:hypothetical protein